MERRHVLAGLAGLALPRPVVARTSSMGPRPDAVGLSIGISNYALGSELPSARGDAALIAATLLRLGIPTELLLDATQEEFLVALARLRLRSEGAKLTLVYVAAHGLMMRGTSHILASDTPFLGLDLLRGSIPESTIIQAVSDRPRQKALFLDTCRELPVGADQPQDADRAGPAPYHAGVHVSYATQPGAPAMDGEDGHSPYATSLVGALETPGLDLSDVARRVRLNVLRQTSGLQIPWERSSLLSRVVLNPGAQE